MTTPKDRHKRLQDLDSPPPSTYQELENFPDLDLPPLDRNRDSEDDFTADLVEGANAGRKYLILAAGVWPSRPLDPLVRGVLIGHAVRLFKLYELMAWMISRRFGDFTLAIARMMAESIINFQYFLKHPTRRVVDTYVRQTLAFEKKLMAEVEARMHDPPWPIEERLIAGSLASFARAGIESGEIEAKEWRGLRSSQKATDLGLENLYEFVFRPGSHYVHGTWHDLYFNHLRLLDGEYVPRIEFARPRPQALEVASIATLEIIEDYLQFIFPNIDENPLLDRIQELRSWFQGMLARGEAMRASA
jgi:hypothetical protein